MESLFYSSCDVIFLCSLLLVDCGDKSEESDLMCCCFIRTNFNLPSLDTEHLLQQKVELSRLGLLDPELKSNLQFATSAMDRIPHMLKMNAELLVEGNQTLLRITAGSPSLHCVVFQDQKGIQLHQTIQFSRNLCQEDIHEAFFHGHECPHDTPCRKQAISMLYPFNRPLELKVFCKELRITFSDPNPTTAFVLPY